MANDHDRRLRIELHQKMLIPALAAAIRASEHVDPTDPAHWYKGKSIGIFAARAVHGATEELIRLHKRDRGEAANERN